MATTWYAQAAGAIQSIEWDTVPTGGGTDLTWPPAADDVLVANGKALTWAAAAVPTLTCARLSTADEDAGGAGVAGGGFALSGSTAVTITADLTAGTTTCLTSTHTGTGANGVTITGAVTGGSGANAHGVRNNSTGTLTITGAVTGGGGANAHGAYATNVGVVTIYGNATGGSGNGAMGVQAWSAANNVTIHGDVTGGSNWATYGAFGNGVNTRVIVIGSIVSSTSADGCGGMFYWQPVAGVHYHKVFHSAGFAEYYTGPPLDEDVRQGVQAGFQSDGSPYIGVFFVPAVTDVKTGVGYGAGGEEFTGTLAAGGGGVPLIGPGGLVG